MTFDPRQPYNDLPPLPPPVEVETKAVLKQAIAANRRVAEAVRTHYDPEYAKRLQK